MAIVVDVADSELREVDSRRAASRTRAGNLPRSLVPTEQVQLSAAGIGEKGTEKLQSRALGIDLPEARVAAVAGVQLRLPTDAAAYGDRE